MNQQPSKQQIHHGSYGSTGTNNFGDSDKSKYIQTSSLSSLRGSIKSANRQGSSRSKSTPQVSSAYTNAISAQVSSAYTNAKSVPNDDATSIRSNVNRKAKIAPCTNFTRYSFWLKKHFPDHVHRQEINFLDNVLKIKSIYNLDKYYAFTSRDWKMELGEHLYRRYVKFIIELVIIWKVTHHNHNDLSYSTYMTIRNCILKIFSEHFIKTIDQPIVRKSMRITLNQQPHMQVPSTIKEAALEPSYIH